MASFQNTYCECTSRIIVCVEMNGTSSVTSSVTLKGTWLQTRISSNTDSPSLPDLPTFCLSVALPLQQLPFCRPTYSIFCMFYKSHFFNSLAGDNIGLTTQLIQMNGLLSSSAEACLWWPFDLNQVCWSRETSKTCRAGMPWGPGLGNTALTYQIPIQPVVLCAIV